MLSRILCVCLPVFLACSGVNQSTSAVKENSDKTDAAETPPEKKEEAKKEPTKRVANTTTKREDLDRDGTPETIEVFEDGTQAFSYDLDGDGTPENISLGDGVVKIGAESAKFPKELAGEYIEFEILDIDSKDNAKELAVIDPGIEDDARYNIFVYRNNKLTGTEVFMGGTQTEDLKGDAVIRVGTYNCGQTIRIEWTLKDGTLSKTLDKTTGKYNEADCAACPYVYVYQEDGTRQFKGEILRYLSRPALETVQSLSLGTMLPVDGKIRIQLSERKPETTYLDAIYLMIGGKQVFPTNCNGYEKWCTSDSSYEVISFGESREFVFEVGSEFSVSAKEMVLWAEGYYLPNQ